MARSAADKTLPGAYGMAILGILLGIVGMHRFYLRRYISATLMTGLFLTGLFMLVSELILTYYSLLSSLSTALTGLSAGGNFASIPDIPTLSPLDGDDAVYGLIIGGISVVWWFIDLFLLPSMVKHYQAARNA